MEKSDSDLCMLEQLTYLNKGVFQAAGIKADSISNVPGKQDRSLSSFLNQFTDDSLTKLESQGEIGDTHMTGKEWAQMLRYLKTQYTGKENDLYITKVLDGEGDDDPPLAICFTENENSDKAIVAFKGTSGSGEWVDNINGFNQVDTNCQKQALEFIESLSYSNVTVTGHSKGGNKAMYVAIRSEKVKRCLAMDAQGFSQEFINKYWAEIQLRGKNITNYSIDVDYVHALMFQIPNSHQVYFHGFNMYDAAQYHCPNSYFKLDENNNLVIENGKVVLDETEIDSANIRMIHEFTTFVLNNGSKQDKQLIVSYLSRIIPLVMDGNTSKDEIVDEVLKDPNALGTILAYLVKYMKEYNLNAEDIDALLEVLQLNKLNDSITLKKIDLPFDYELDVNLNLYNILNYMKKQLTDDNDDWFTKFILNKLKNMFAKELNLDVENFWDYVDDKVKQIDGNRKSGDAFLRSGQTFDYSEEAYHAAIETIQTIEKVGTVVVDSWNNYSGEEWHSSLFISAFVNAIDDYFDKMSVTNENSRKKLEETFDNISNVDTAYAGRIESYNQEISALKCGIQNISNYINV